MNILDNVIFSGAFLVFASISFLLALQWKFKKMKELIKNPSSNVKALKDDVKLIEARKSLAKLSEISKEQINMYEQMKQPSKNALHSKHKNNLIDQFKELQKEKVKVIKDVLKTGFDPEVVVYSAEGSLENIKLSEYLKRLNESVSNTETNSTEKKKTIRKFTVIKGGKTSH